MAKVRNLTMSRSERYLGSYSNGHSHETVTDEPDLGEDDVWSAVSDDRQRQEEESGERYGAWMPRAWVPSNRRVSGLSSLAFEDSQQPPPPTSSMRIVHQVGGNDGNEGRVSGRHVAASAPVNVPDWRKIYRVNSVECMNESEEEEEGESRNMVPPHEYLARSQARRSRKTGGGGGSGGSSVFEGVGRTLKGRDLRRVRDAVWSQTGFFG